MTILKFLPYLSIVPRVVLLLSFPVDEYPIDLQDSLEEPRIPTPPLPDLVPSLNTIPNRSDPSPEPLVGKAENTECNPWDLMGLSDSLDFRESQSLVLKESDIQDLLDKQEVEGTVRTSLILARKRHPLNSFDLSD